MPRKKKRVWSEFAGRYLVKGSRDWKRERESELKVLRELDPEETLKWMDREKLAYPGARAQLHKETRRLGGLEDGGRDRGVSRAGAGVPSWLQKPWRTTWPVPPGQYGRWGEQGNWPWYAPQAQVADQPHLAIINRLLPYMNQEDITTMARQLYTAGGGAGGPFKGYLGAEAQAPPVPTAPTPTSLWGGEGWSGQKRGRRAPVPPAPPSGTYRKTIKTIEGILGRIPDATAKAWAKSVFDVYRDWTRQTGMRTSLEQSEFGAQLGELFENVPESAQPYAAAMQRLTMPTISRPEFEWYELPEEQRTSPTSWRALGLTANPAWF